MEIFFHLTLPGDATFDVDALEQNLAASPVTFRYSHRPEVTYVVCSSPAMRAYFESEFRQNPKIRSTTNGFISLRPTFLTVGQYSPQEILEQMAILLLPILRRYDCMIVNEYGLDLTERYRTCPERLFDPDWTPPDVEQAIAASEERQKRLWQERTQAKNKTNE